MVCDLKDLVEKGNINCTLDAEKFILLLWNLLDEYLPFLDQLSIDQLGWLQKLHAKYIEDVW